jgi:hypothetical protein
MELTILGINILLLIAVWKFMLRKTMLDSSRDQLFDLRDELRAVFVKNGWNLNSPSYRNLRDLVNGHLRFTEEMSVSRVSYIAAAIKKDKELLAYQHEKIAKIFDSSDPVQKRFIDDFRKRAVTVAMNYAVYSSGWLLLIAFFVFPFVATWKICVVINRQVDLTANVCAHSLRHFGRTMSIVMASSAACIGNAFLQPDFVEGYSYRKGIAV